MTDTSIEILTAIRARLLADATVSDLVGSSIYTHIPQNTSVPYIRIGLRSSPVDLWQGQEHVYIVTVQGFFSSINLALQAKKAIYNALQRQEANMNDITSINHNGFSDVFQEKESYLWQAIITFKVESTTINGD